MRRGLWVDCPPRTVLAPGYLALVRDLGVQGITLVAQDTSGRWRWSVAQVAHLCGLARAADLGVGIMTWPLPGELRSAWADEVAARAEHGACALEVDLEGQWRGVPAARASQLLVETLFDLRSIHDVRLEVTTFPSHPEASEAARVTPCVDQLNVQIYSVRHAPGGRLVDPRGRYGPGRYQREALATAAARPWAQGERAPRLGVGLAAWSQDWPATSPEEALRLAREGVVESGVRVVEERWWSSKWVVGKWASPWAARTIRGA